MISQLLDEPYVTKLPEVSWQPASTVYNYDFWGPGDLSIFLNDDFSDFFNIKSGIITPFYVDSTRPILVDSNKALASVIQDNVNEIELALLEACFSFNKFTEHRQFRKLNVQKKCEALGISNYLNDRNLNDLGLYCLFMKEAAK